MINREGYYVTDKERECTSCGTVFEITSRMTLCKPCNSRRVKETQTVERKLWARARDRCLKSGKEFSIDVEDIIIPELCPYLGIKLEPHSGSSGGKPYSPSLDRIDNSAGYTRDNIQVISHLANQMKANASREELLIFAKNVLKIFGTD